MKIGHGCVEDFQVRRLGRRTVLRDDMQAGVLGRVQLVIVGGVDVLQRTLCTVRRNVGIERMVGRSLVTGSGVTVVDRAVLVQGVVHFRVCVVAGGLRVVVTCLCFGGRPVDERGVGGVGFLPCARLIDRCLRTRPADFAVRWQVSVTPGVIVLIARTPGFARQ